MNSMSEHTKWTTTLNWYNKIPWFYSIAKWCALRKVWQTNLICDINRNCDYVFIFIDDSWNGNNEDCFRNIICYWAHVCRACAPFKHPGWLDGVCSLEEELKMSQPIAMLAWCHFLEWHGQTIWKCHITYLKSVCNEGGAACYERPCIHFSATVKVFSIFTIFPFSIWSQTKVKYLRQCSNCVPSEHFRSALGFYIIIITS